MARDNIKHTVKDSVFTNLFQDRKYLLQLYKTLHPEDNEITEEGLTNITIKNVFTDGIYNDLGFMAGDRVLILVEAQSTWTMNIIIRALMYLAQTCHEYFARENIDLYGSRKIKMPRPELYMIFTGERAERPQTISLSEEFFGGGESSLEVKVRIIYGEDPWEASGEGKERDIISQYIIFTKIYQEQLKLHKRTKRAVMETIRICKDRNVLKEYLENREGEVMDIMTTLFDEEYILRVHILNKEKEAAEKAAKEVTKRINRETIERLLRMGKLSVEEIATCIPGISLEEICQIKENLA